MRILIFGWPPHSEIIIPDSQVDNQCTSKVTTSSHVLIIFWLFWRFVIGLQKFRECRRTGPGEIAPAVNPARSYHYWWSIPQTQPKRWEDIPDFCRQMLSNSSSFNGLGARKINRSQPDAAKLRPNHLVSDFLWLSSSKNELRVIEEQNNPDDPESEGQC